MRRAALVLDTASGGLLGRADPETEVATMLHRVGPEAVVAADADASGLDARLDAAVAAGAGLAPGILPLGAMNVLAKDLRLPLELEAAVAALGRGRVRPIDVAEVNERVRGEPNAFNDVLVADDGAAAVRVRAWNAATGRRVPTD